MRLCLVAKHADEGRIHGKNTTLIIKCDNGIGRCLFSPL